MRLERACEEILNVWLALHCVVLYKRVSLLELGINKCMEIIKDPHLAPLPNLNRKWRRSNFWPEIWWGLNFFPLQIAVWGGRCSAPHGASKFHSSSGHIPAKYGWRTSQPFLSWNSGMIRRGFERLNTEERLHKFAFSSQQIHTQESSVNYIMRRLREHASFNTLVEITCSISMQLRHTVR